MKASKGAAVEIVALDAEDTINDILWSSNQSGDIIPLDERIERKRRKVNRNWQKGQVSEANWLLSNGSRITIRDKPSPIDSLNFLR